MKKISDVYGTAEYPDVLNTIYPKFEKISFDEVLSKSLAVADAAAFSLCRENALPIVVFDLKTKGNIARAVKGDAVGTLVN